MILVNNLSKEYRIYKQTSGFWNNILHLISPEYIKKEVVHNISFHINKGECVAFLGANGAGKSTTIKMLTGILKPTSGQIKIMERDPFKNRIENSKNIGVVFGQKSQLWWDIPVIETFRLLKNIYEIPTEQYKENIKLYSKVLDLDDIMKQPARKLSLGQRVRADIAASLLHNPAILFLDEPTIGLDVAVKQKIYKFLKYINTKRQVTILLTSHDIKDIETLCQRMIILEHGNIIFDDAIEKIYYNYSHKNTLEEIIIELFNKR